MTQQDLTALITDNLDIWSSAIQSKSRTGRGSNKTYELYGIKKLRALILDLAVRGMLVPQDPNDEPASVLLKKIAIEKEQLIKDKKIRNQNSSLKIVDKEIPFKIPETWRFCRFGDVTFNRDGERKPVSLSDRKNMQGQFDYYGASGVIDKVNDYLFDKSLLLIGEDGANLISRRTPIAFIAHGKYWVNNHAHVIDGISIEYLKYIALFINAITLEPYITGTAQPKMNQTKMNSIVIAIPPEEEQKRIVAKVDQLMALCDKLEQQTYTSIKAHKLLVENLLNALTQAKDHKIFQHAWQRIAQHFDTLFTTEHSIDQLKQTILQLAVMGKLVPQNPNDEPASELLKKIAIEKQQLIKQGKIKKQKPLPEIKEDEKPFELPDGWEFVRLGNVYDVSSSKRIHVKDYVDNGVPFFRSKEVGELGKGKEVSTKLFISEEQYLQLKNNIGFPSQNDFLLASIGGSIGNNWICDEREFYYKDGNITKIGNHNFANMNYLKFFIDSDLFWDQMKIGVAGSAYNALTIVKLKNMLYSLPPLVEQRRIVIKVDELMDLCQKMKSQITKSKMIQTKIADTLTQL